ncbi:MAG: hypothetical protein ABIG60_03050 [Patescibacteria group bacterium]
MGEIIRDVTGVNDLNKMYIKEIVNSAIEIYRELREGDAKKFSNNLTGSKCIVTFLQESLRTYSSFVDAFRLLGAESIDGFRNPKESSLAKGESNFHTIDTFIGQGVGLKFLVIRDGLEGSARWAKISAFRSYAKKLREYAKVYRSVPQNLILPIIFNGASGQQTHPSQLLLDCTTLAHKFGRFTDLNFGICNDIGGSRVASSHIDASSKLGWTLHLCPFENAGLNPRQALSVLNNEIPPIIYKQTPDMFGKIDLLYINRYQFNLRGKNTGDHAASIFSESHPQISLPIIEKWGLPIFHARPIDKNAKEMAQNLEDHPYDYSGIQSDFGVPTRMAMCIYALENRLFSFEGIIKSLNPQELGFYLENLSAAPSTKIKHERYTVSELNNCFVIDHIPLGCGGVISNLISKLYPEIQIVLSMNVKGDNPLSIPKDNIKLFVQADFKWTDELSNIVALLTDYTAKKSCRVSEFRNGKRVNKWAFRFLNNNGDICINERCIAHLKNKEEINFKHLTVRFNGHKIKVCPFCGMPQNNQQEILEAFYRYCKNG